jgi:Gluconate 2-dehydrogenase subunit 3
VEAGGDVGEDETKPLHSHLTRDQETTLIAMVEAIVPPDEYPGGVGAGVLDYFARQFDADLRAELARYRQGLDAAESEAFAVYDRRLASLGSDERDLLIRAIESGMVRTPWPIDPAAFFDEVVTHVMEGFYGDPRNGGNHHGISWEMIGFQVSG